MIRNKWMMPVFAFALLTSACSNDPENIEEIEPEVATMRLTIGNQIVNVNAITGAVTGGPINLIVNTSTAVTATFLRADGSPDPIVTGTDFRLDVAQMTTGISFTRTGPFAGTLRGTTTGNGSARFVLYSIDHSHNEFDWPVPISVTAVVGPQ